MPAADTALRRLASAPTDTTSAARNRVDPFSKKDWYDVKAPSSFSLRTIGKTLVTRTQGTKVRDIATRMRCCINRPSPVLSTRPQLGLCHADCLGGSQGARLRVQPGGPAERESPPSCCACCVHLRGAGDDGDAHASSLCSLQNEADAYRKIRLRAEDVQGRNVLTNFWVSMGHIHRPLCSFLCPCSVLVS